MNHYGITLSVDRPTLDGTLLDQLIEQYLIDVTRRSDAKTARGYRHKLRHFRVWWKTHGPEYDWELSSENLVRFLRYLEELESARGAPLSYNSRRDVMRRLRQVLRWAHRRGHIPIDFSDDVPLPSGSPPPRHPVDLAALDAMLLAAYRTNHPLRDRAIIAMLAGTGIRCEECAGLRIEDVTIYADGTGIAFIREAKNDKPRYVAFDQVTGIILSEHLAILTSQIGPFFQSRKGRRQPLSSSGIYKIISRIAIDAKVDDQIRGPHDLRRMFATLWTRRLRGAGYGQLLQKQLGHASWETTQSHYVLQDIGDVLDVLRSEAVSPLAQLTSQGLMQKPNGASPFKATVSTGH